MFRKETCKKEKTYAGEKAAVFPLLERDYSFKISDRTGVKSGEILFLLEQPIV